MPADELTALALEASTAMSPPDTDPDMALRVRGWFLEAWNSKLWTDYRKEAEEDEGFYTGGEDQWSVDGSAAELDRLKGLRRAHVSLNEVQGIVDILLGFEQQNRFDLKADPESQEDDQDARLFTWLLKDVQDRTNAHDTCSEVFEDEIVRGLGAVEVGVDWTQDPARGRIVVERLTPGWDLLWDPFGQDWTEFTDCRYMIRFKSGFLGDLIAQYPQHKAAIEAAAERLDFTSELGEGKSTDGPPGDAYGPVGGARDPAVGRMFWDPKARKALILEAWYEDFESAWVVSNKTTGEVHEAESAQVARQTAAGDPKVLTAIRRLRRVIKMAVVLPATLQTLEKDDTPYDNDDQAYPFVVSVGKRKGQKVYGIVRNLKDPQRVLNKRESQILDILIQYGNLRPMYEQGALENPATLEDMWATKPIVTRPGHDKPTWYTPPVAELFRVLTAEGERHELFMRKTSGINTDLLGLREKGDPSGIAIARVQAQGQVTATVWFTHFRAFKRQFGRRLARRIQQVYTYERVVRLTNDLGEPFQVSLNPLDFKGKTRDEIGRMQMDPRRRVLKDVSALEFDIKISEAPATPSMRGMSLLAVLEIVKTAPALGLVFLDTIVELADVPDKAAKVQAVRQIQASQGLAGGPAVPANGQPPGAGATAPPPGAPPGGPPLFQPPGP